MRIALASILVLTTTSLTWSQRSSETAERRSDPAQTGQAKASAPTREPEPARPVGDDDKPIVKRHSIQIGGKALDYEATTGLMPLRDSKGEVEARIFYIAYTIKPEGGPTSRPLMFSFNGGPGSSSVWLHLGAVGPKRVVMPDDATYAAPPFKLIDNESSWLDKTDLVFIDPVGTGYSRAAKPELNQKFHGLRGDIDSVGEFIRMYLTRNDRWNSPIYLVGESYGTTRAAGLSDHLLDQGVALNGIVLISSVLDFQTLEFARGNDEPYILYLPSYTATAWYHKKLPSDLQSDLKKTLAEAEKWAETDYREALGKGDRMTAEERSETIAKLARYTGLSKEVVENNDLRISQDRFCKELLRGQKRTVGRLDARFKGVDETAGESSPEFDPSMAAIRAPYTATFNDYVRTKLGYKSDVVYHILGGGVGRWDWGSSGMGYPDTAKSLRDAMAKNPYMKIFVASGFYDLATPYLATDYTLAHMRLDSSFRKNIKVETYESGHMMYIHGPSLMKLKSDVAAFIDGSKESAGR